MYQALLAMLGSISPDDIDVWCDQPSLLPKWSRGYVLAHLSRNADSHSHLFSEAALGREGEQYAGGLKGRAEGIATEATLSGKELVRRTKYLDEKGFFVGNHQIDLTQEINHLYNILQ